MTTARRWFDRTFELGLRVEEAPALLERLRLTADRLEAAARDLPAALVAHHAGGRWSIKENIGHLTDLEALWDQRLDDFDRGVVVLAAADLENRKTHDARHNDRPLSDLLREFRSARKRIVERLDAMDAAALARVGTHPRLQQDMSVVDLCFFVAEHDDHHIRTIADIAQSLDAFPESALDLWNTVEQAEPALLAFDDETARRRPAPGKWSAKEIIGHLIDSASNNHQRFVRAVFQDDLMFAGYDQAQWVIVQHYQDAPWNEMVALWASFNRHLAHVMASVPQTTRRHRHARHNLHRIAWQPVEEHEPASLDYMMDDYVGHLHHHLRQIAVIVPAFQDGPPP
jgi:uncharacterized damage-inducible protein DinB